MKNNEKWQDLKDYVDGKFLSIPKETLGSWEEFWELFLVCNNKVNLTRIVDLEEALLKHFLDSWLILDVYFRLENKVEISRFMDFGCGGGFPSLPLMFFFLKHTPHQQFRQMFRL